ncbi:tetratricopeptide [Hypomontagnella submonticulosa]|nr:tetratricopeptide [Hypomontagnella submonticulosa]
MATTTKQRLALAICDFLSASLTDGTLSAEDKDSIDVAINCIGESFKVDPSDTAAVKAATGSQNLLQIYGVYEKLKSTTTSSTTNNPPTDTAAPTSAAASSDKVPTDAEKAQAEDLKAKGNRAMAAKDYPTAIDMYSQALNLHPTNVIYLSNRAAAYSAARDHASARADAEAAVRIDPTYTKAWSRLGLARFALGDAKGAMEAYQKGIEHEGNGGSEAMKKGFDVAKRRVEELEAEAADTVSSPGAGARGAGPDLGGLASLLGGGAGGSGGGGGGMPDLGSIMNNPMFASMAQNLMSNPDMMQNLMSNPRLREMADRFSSGGGMPDLGALMSDPNIADMARNMMGGGGGGAGNGGAGAGRGAGQ